MRVHTTRMSSFKNAVVRSSTLMHFSASLKSFYMVHDKLCYFLFKLIAKSGPEKLVQVLFFFNVFNYFLIKLHKKISNGTVP